MKVYGYVRASRDLESIEEQCRVLLEVGVKKFFCDLRSGQSKVSPARKQLLDTVKKGDKVIVTELSRISRCSVSGIGFLQELLRKEVEFVSLRDQDCSFADKKSFRKAHCPILTKFFLVNMEYAMICDRIESNPRSAKKKIVDSLLEEVVEEFAKTPNIRTVLSMEKFKKFSGSEISVFRDLEELGLKVPRIPAKVVKITQLFDDLAKNRRKYNPQRDKIEL